VALFFLLAAAVPTSASVISLTGVLNPMDANDALLVAFSLSASGTVDIQSYGFGGSSKAPGGTTCPAKIEVRRTFSLSCLSVQR
jgi:hypothetical protein